VTFEIQAHRGNDQLTLRRLLRSSPSSVEIDVGVAGGELVVAHDTDHGDATGLRLEQALAAAGSTPLVVEAKCVPGVTPAAADFVAALRSHLSRIRLCSFDADVLAGAREARPGLATTFLFSAPVAFGGLAPTVGPRHDLVTRELVEAAQAAGQRVVPWTVNDVGEMAALIDLGVDGLVTDEPSLARAVLESRVAVAA
jgi:glycerophosphoryl diester phosphodiesterase